MLERSPSQYRKVFPRQVKTFGDILRKQRGEHGLKQKKLAAMMGVSSNTIQKWEHDKVEPNSEQMAKLATLLNLSD
jgi:ribosome-binding protein aMBF1 (putative translation factor)